MSVAGVRITDLRGRIYEDTPRGSAAPLDDQNADAVGSVYNDSTTVLARDTRGLPTQVRGFGGHSLRKSPVRLRWSEDLRLQTLESTGIGRSERRAE